MQNRKNICLKCGREEGFGWTLALEISEKTKIFAGHFTTTEELQNQRQKIRLIDRNFFKARLGKKYMADKVLHHNWIENSPEYSKVVLVHKSEHPNGGIDILRDIDRKRWTANEKWLDSC